MDSLQSAMQVLKQQLQQGDLITAYQDLMDFIRDLRSRFEKQHPEFSLPGNIYLGYLDMTYFSIVPPTLVPHKLKIAVVFVCSRFRFEVWFSGINRGVQAKFSQKVTDIGWGQYPLSLDLVGRIM